VTDPLAVYAAGLHGAPLRARVAGGGTAPLPTARWLAAADPVDRRVLARAAGPVLDLGCGPGRHVRALARAGVPAVGVDLSPAAVALVRAAGAPAIHASVFGRLPGAGTWGTALLLDGNIGIGGRPVPLLRRAARLLRAGGHVLCELDPPGSGCGVDSIRLEAGDTASAWFPWARVAADGVGELAAAAGLCVASVWADEGRWFALLWRAA
jgi:SAM-dependent methyltransferase